MTDLEKAARMALEALEVATTPLAKDRQEVLRAQAALRQALEQPAQQSAERGEPVGQLMEEAYGRGQVLWFNKPDDFSMLYTSPQRKPWVGLDASDYCGQSEEWCDGALAAEAKLKEKNA
jgi:hypothetical protein